MLIKHPVKVWKMVPAAWGIGLALVVTMLINAVLNGVTVAYALYYLIFVVQSVSNWQLEMNAYISTHILESNYVIINSNMSIMCITTFNLFHFPMISDWYVKSAT